MTGRRVTLDQPCMIDGEQSTVAEAILTAVRVGVPRYIAAQAAGIHKTTLRRWEAIGAELRQADVDEGNDAVELTENQERVRAFCADLEKADAEAVQFAVEQVRAAMPDNWTAAMTFLERRHPRDFGRSTRIEGEVRGEITMPDGEVKRLDDRIDALMARLAGAGEATPTR